MSKTTKAGKLNGSAQLLADAVRMLFEESREILTNTMKETETTMLAAISHDIDKGIDKVRSEVKSTVASEMAVHSDMTQQQISQAFDKAGERRAGK